MKETHITIYIHDLEISDKSKSFLARVGLMKLDDLLNCNMTELSAMRNISEDVLQELNGVIDHSDVIISFFEERAKRIKEIAIANTKKSERQTQVTQRDVAIDCLPSWILRETILRAASTRSYMTTS